MNDSTCKIDGCERERRSAGYCRMHYARVRKTGDPGPASPVLHSNAGSTCRGPECSRPASRKGLCGSHYAALRRTGELRPLDLAYAATRNMTLAERVEHYSSEPDAKGCRRWTGALNERGYPVVNGGAASWGNLAHRVSYMLATGEDLLPYIPVHHMCGVASCVEPSHLKPVESWENSAEMLERNYYLKRINQLEDALRQLAPGHELIRSRAA